MVYVKHKWIDTGRIFDTAGSKVFQCARCGIVGIVFANQPDDLATRFKDCKHHSKQRKYALRTARNRSQR